MCINPQILGGGGNFSNYLSEGGERGKIFSIWYSQNIPLGLFDNFEQSSTCYY